MKFDVYSIWQGHFFRASPNHKSPFCSYVAAHTSFGLDPRVGMVGDRGDAEFQMDGTTLKRWHNQNGLVDFWYQLNG